VRLARLYLSCFSPFTLAVELNLIVVLIGIRLREFKHTVGEAECTAQLRTAVVGKTNLHNEGVQLYSTMNSSLKDAGYISTGTKGSIVNAGCVKMRTHKKRRSGMSIRKDVLMLVKHRAHESSTIAFKSGLCNDGVGPSFRNLGTVMTVHDGTVDGTVQNRKKAKIWLYDSKKAILALFSSFQNIA
jgi:hypothetical protein